MVAELAPGVPLVDYAQFAPEDRLRLLGRSARIAEGKPVPMEATAVRDISGTFRPLPPLSDIDPRQALQSASDVPAVPDEL